MAKAKNSFVAYYEWEDMFSDFTDEQLGGLFRAVYAYEKRGEAYEGRDPAIKLAMRFISGALDRNQEKYKERCEKNRQNALKRWGAGSDGMQPDANAHKCIKNDENTCENMRTDAKNADHEREHEREPEHEPEPEHEHDAAAAAVSFFREQVSENMTAQIERDIREACSAVGEETVMDAMWEAAKRNKRTWGYCKGILDNWQKQGHQTPRPNALCPPRPMTAAEKAAEEKRLEETRRRMKALLAQYGERKDNDEQSDSAGAIDGIP